MDETTQSQVFRIVARANAGRPVPLGMMLAVAVDLDVHDEVQAAASTEDALVILSDALDAAAIPEPVDPPSP